MNEETVTDSKEIVTDSKPHQLCGLQIIETIIRKPGK